MDKSSLQSCWVITDGSAGMVNQCLGVAESLGLSIEQKRIRLRAPWKWLTPYFSVGLRYAWGKDSASLEGPFPDVAIACGRQAILALLFIKKASHYQTKIQTKIIYIQNPSIDPHHFDAVIVPKHDNISGKNVIQAIGAPHRVTAQKLHDEKEKFSAFKPSLSQEKVIGVLIGGPCNAYAMEDESVQDFVTALQKLAGQGHRLLISPSRRTPQRVIDILHERLGGRAYIWDRQGENPYFGILAHGDALFVTCDSVCMITEACVTDKPVYLLPLKGGRERFSLFHSALLALGRVKWWHHQNPASHLDFNPVEPLDENAMIVDRLRQIL